MPDLLSDQPPAQGALVFNHGDPAYRPYSRTTLPITASEEIFLRMLSYLPFAEAVIVPGRHLLEGQSAFEASTMALPLLKQGLIIPERRSGPTSFVAVANERRLNELQTRRGVYLDQHSHSVREFRWDALSARYRELLLDDLGPSGAFRRIVPGGIQGSLKLSIDGALEFYRTSDSVTPEGFISAVERACPQAAALARRWAMARYYITPSLFDDVHVRQVPREAAELLVRGQAIDQNLRPTEGIAPADRLAQELLVGIQIDDVKNDAEAYCEAVLRVRDDLPEARRLFSKVLDSTEAREIGTEVNAAMSKELNRQLKKRIVDNPVYSLGIDLVGGVIGAAAGLPLGPGGAVTTGGAAALVTAGAKRVVIREYDKRARPWQLAIDQLTSHLKRIRSRKVAD